jgi:hypothetical protein
VVVCRGARASRFGGVGIGLLVGVAVVGGVGEGVGEVVVLPAVDV